MKVLISRITKFSVNNIFKLPATILGHPKVNGYQSFSMKIIKFIPIKSVRYKYITITLWNRYYSDCQNYCLT